MPETEGTSPTGFNKFVTLREFEQYCTTNDKDHKKIMNALWGPDGGEGIVQVVNEIKLYQKIIMGIVLFIQPVLIVLVMRWLGI